MEESDFSSPAALIEMQDLKKRTSKGKEGIESPAALAVRSSEKKETNDRPPAIPISNGNHQDVLSPSAANPRGDIVTPSVVRKTPRELKNRRVVFKWLPTFGFVSDYLHGAWWFVWGSLVSAVFPIPPLIDAYSPGSVFKVQPNPNASDHPQTFFEVETSWWSLIAMGIFFTVGSLIFARPYYTPPLPPLFKGNAWLRNDDILAAWMFFIASIPSLGYVASFLAADTTSVIYWGMTFAAIIFVFLSAVFLYYSYVDDYAETNMLQKILVKMLGEKTWIVKHCENDILTALWICFWGCLGVTAGSVMYTIWGIWIRGPGVEIYTCAIGAFDCFLFTAGFAYFVSGRYIKEERLHHSHATSP